MANLITLSRLVLLALVILILYFAPPYLQLFNVFLLILVFVSDGMDGYVARKRNETSLFGALFDVAADRIVELSLWVVFAHIGVIPVLIPLIYIARGIITDSIRASEAQSNQQTPYATMKTRIAKIVVAGRFMRAFYAVLKAVTFCVLILLVPLPQLFPSSSQQFGSSLEITGLILAIACVVLCIARGLPVITQFLRKQTASYEQ